MIRLPSPPMSLALLFALLPQLAAAAGGQLRFVSSGIVCASCAKKVVRVLRKDPRVTDARVDVDLHQVTVALKEGTKVSDAELRELIAPTGFEIDSIER